VRLILASRSPQRRAILNQLGLRFEVVVPDVAELDGGVPDEVVAENARRKAAAVAPPDDDALILGVDTLVALDGRIYGKPGDATAARDTLRALSGRVHTVLSGVCVRSSEQAEVAVARTEVAFREIGEPHLARYLDSGEWRERAGGYAIQGRGAAFVTAIRGDYSNVVGLPVALLLEMVPTLLSS
jgi:septum formation protein